MSWTSSLPPRSKSYKKTVVVDADDARRKREGSLEEIRNNIRQHTLLKKRTDQPLIPLFPQSPTFNIYAHSLERNHVMVQKIWSSDPAAQLEATNHFCNLLEIEGGLLIDEVIEAGVVPRFVDFLGMHDAPQLQIAAACALSNISAGKSEQTLLVIKLGVVPLFVELLLHSGSEDVRAQVIWGLANVAGDSPTNRDLVLNHGALLPLLAQLSRVSNKLSTLRVAAWAISNLCRGKPPPKFQQVKPALPKLRELIELDDEQVIAQACMALSCIVLSNDGRPIENIQAVLDTGLCPRLVQLLQHPNYAIIIPALRIVGNLVNGDHTQTQIVIDNGVLPSLHKLITNNSKIVILKEACWAISNIAAGNTEQVHAVIHRDIIPSLVFLLQYAELEVKIEAAWAIFNATNAGTRDHIKLMVNKGRCIKPLCDMLVSSDPTAVVVCLDGLDNILTVGEADKRKGLHGGINIYAQMVDRCAGLDKIRKLQAHENRAINVRAVNMVKKYFHNTNPTQQQQDFTFHVPMPPPTRLPPFLTFPCLGQLDT